jgi:hypothetical protein
MRIALPRRSSVVLRSVSAVATLVAAAALTGCSSPDQVDTTSEPAVPTITRMTSTETLVLPLDQFLLSRQDGSRVQAAYRLRLRQCVAGFGLDLVVPGAPSSRSDPGGPNARRYGVADTEIAAVFGYGLPPDPAGRKPPQPTLSAEVETVLSGKGPSSINGKPVPTGGCVAKAQGDINGRSTVDASLAERLAREAFTRSEADSRTQAAVRRWSTCMQAKGFTYSSPDNAVADPRFTSGGPTSALEIRTAQADIACKLEVGLLGVRAAVEKAYQERLVAQHLEALNALRGLHEAQLRTAASVLGAAR